jgi:hypothetical protein
MIAPAAGTAVAVYAHLLNTWGFHHQFNAERVSLAAEEMDVAFLSESSQPWTDVSVLEYIGFRYDETLPQSTVVHSGVELRLPAKCGVTRETVRNALSYFSLMRPHSFQYVFFQPENPDDIVWLPDLEMETSGATGTKARMARIFKDSVTTGHLSAVSVDYSRAPTDLVHPVNTLYNALKHLNDARFEYSKLLGNLLKIWPA